jgi:glycosyltransferase involved in cell wall biosynthesis
VNRANSPSTLKDGALRITIVNGPFYPTPPAPTGAVQRLWSDLAREFANRGHLVTMLACRYQGQEREELRDDGVMIHRRTSMTQGRWIYFDLLKDLWHNLRVFPLIPRGDVVITNSFWAPILLRGRPSAGKIVVCANRVPKGQFRLYKNAARLQAVSKAIADGIIAQCPPVAPRVKVIPNPIDTDVFRPPQRERWTGESRTILFTGRIHPEKGVHTLVEAFSELHRARPNLRLRLVGPSRVGQGGGGDDYMRRLRASAGDHPIEIMEPVFDRASLAKILQDADYYTYPTLAEQGEALPVAPLEAMATGLAPVVSDIPQFRDYIEPERTGLVYEFRTSDVSRNLAAALGRLIDDDALARRMGANALVRAQDFSYPKVTEMFLDDFRSLLDAPGHAAGGSQP